MKKYSTKQLTDMVGEELEPSAWLMIDQDTIDQFARCTGDNQWIHVSPERAAKESPFGTTVAHGYLTLSLVGSLSMQVGVIPIDASAAFNYGLDKVRFIAPVPSGSRVRLRSRIQGMEPKEGGQFLMRTMNTIEIENSDKPALIAETLALIIPQKP
jgi:acyl dehydratase